MGHAKFLRLSSSLFQRSMRREAASLTTYFERFCHRFADSWTVLTFGLPFGALPTRVHVGATTLYLKQWSGNLVGSGGYVWGASRRLCTYLEAYGDGSPRNESESAVQSRAVETLRLLSLGSGAGACGLAAAVLGFAHVTLSDQASFRYPSDLANAEGPAPPAQTLVDLARENVRWNEDALSRSLTSVSVARLLWGDRADHDALPHATYDVICGSDILLFMNGLPQLLATLRCLSKDSTVVLIEHSDRGVWEGQVYGYPPELKNFFRAVEADGLWQPSVVRDVGRHITLRMVRRK